MKRTFFATVNLVCACALATMPSTTCRGELFSSEPFSAGAYVDGTELPTLDPIIPGYSGPWTDVDFGDAEAAVAAGSLAYSGAGYAAGSGNHVAKGVDAAGIGGGNSGRVYRPLGSSLTVSDATSGTLYLSWLFQTGNENPGFDDAVYQTFALYHDTGGAAPAGDAAQRIFDAGLSTADFGVGTNYAFRYNNTTVGDLGVAADSDVHLFVAKFDLSVTAASDNLTVWLDPALGGAGDPAGGVALTGLDMQFESIALSDYSSNSVAWDEFRWGDTFSSVTTESFLACDVNGDNACNSVDFGIILDHMYTSGTLADGDLTGDGVIDLSDYRVFKDDPNRVVGGALSALSGNGVAVPEPASFLCLSIVSMLICAGRNSNRCLSQCTNISVSSIG